MKTFTRLATLLMVPALVAGAALVAVVSPAEAAVTRAQQVVNLTNAQRVKFGCGKLKVNAALTKAAGTHSRDMANRGYFSHVSPGGSTFVHRAKYQGYNFALSENIAYGYATPSAVMNAWMKSSGHKKNIVNCKAKTVGVGVVFNSKGVPYWTQMFGYK